MTLTPLGRCPTPDLGHLIANADDPPVFSLQPPGSAGELWCGVVVPSPPCSPILKSNTSEANAIDYGQAKGRSVHQYSGNTDGQGVKNNTLAKETVGRSKSSNSTSMNKAMRDSTTSGADMPPLSRKCFSPPQRPGTAGLPVTPTLSLPEVQPRPSSAPVCSSATNHPAITPSFRPSTPGLPPYFITSLDVPINVPLKEESDTDLLATKRNNAASMSEMMGLGTCQTIASSILTPTTIPVPSFVQGPPVPRMPQVCSTQVNGGYPPLAMGAVPPINYNMFGMVNIHTTPSARRGGFPFFVPQQLQPTTVPQNLPGHVSHTANAYIPGFPAFVPTPINGSWGVLPSQTAFPMMPCPNIAYPNFQHHANERQFNPINKASNVLHGQQINDSAFKQQNSNILPAQRQFIVHDPSSFSMTTTQEGTMRGKRRRTSVSTASSSTSSSSGSEYDATSFSIASVASTASTSLSSIAELQPDPTFICRLDDCNARLQSADKRSFNHHLILGHSFHGSGNRELTRCKWRDEGDGTVCGKVLQMQSIVKHVCEKHFNSLGRSCSLCGSRQARADNMARHLVVCKPFAGVGREAQRKIWEELVPNKSFDEVYLEGRNVKRRKVEV